MLYEVITVVESQLLYEGQQQFPRGVSRHDDISPLFEFRKSLKVSSKAQSPALWSKFATKIMLNDSEISQSCSYNFV